MKMLKMRFHKGSTVEVLSKKKDLLGAWRFAQIVEGNGDVYTVRYYRSLGVAKEGVDKVAMEAVRPRPPSAAGSAVWAVGDVVEVLDDGFWRVSMIEEVLENDEYYIQVIGSVDEFKVKKSSIRGRQEWIENQWLPMGKDSGIDEKLVSRMQKMAQMQKQGDLIYEMEVQDSILLSKKLKGSSLGNSSLNKASQNCVEIRRTVDKEVERHIVDDAYSFIGKVDTSVNSIKETQVAEKVQLCEHKSNCENHLARVSEYVCESSVASCDVLDANLDRLICHSSASCSEDNEYLYSDAESLNHKGAGEAMEIDQSKQEDTVRMHELELNSYRSTLEALYDCGPLNWELEAYLTNLRQKYCVSNDEHLMELKRLRSIRGPSLSCY